MPRKKAWASSIGPTVIAAMDQASPLGWTVVAPLILTSFKRAEAPERIATEDFGQPKCLAIKPTSSALAFPSTGEDRRRAIQLPQASGSSELTGERGFTRTVITNKPSPGDFVACVL